MNRYQDLSKISKITDNIFLSGTMPIENDPKIIKRLNIKYILSCVDRYYVSGIHSKILASNPDLIILCVPYDDDLYQNLWETNKNKITMIRHHSPMYDNKPMIEIGYHFINNVASSGQNILVHCMAGISRSVSLVVYFLMKKYYISFDKAISFVKNKRPIANPNDSFKMQLRYYGEKRDKFTEKDSNDIINSIGDYS